MAEIISKETIRKKMVNSLAKISEEKKERKSLLIKEKLFTRPDFKSAERVMFYVSTPREVQTKKMIAETLSLNKTVVVPKCNLAQAEMMLYQIRDLRTDLQEGAYGILEPFKEEDRYSGGLDLGVVPGIAFDRRGTRLGRGKGYFDKLFSREIYQNVYKIALSFEEQLTGDIAREEHDVLMDEIVTEADIYFSKQ